MSSCIFNIIYFQINAVHLYPYHLRKLSNLPEPEEDLSSLVYIFISGEKPRLDVLAKLKEILLKTLICQTYEHTELAGFITIFDFSKAEDSIFNHFVNISCGRPIGGVWYKVFIYLILYWNKLQSNIMETVINTNSSIYYNKVFDYMESINLLLLLSTNGSFLPIQLYF